jgi:hypothetical protein
MEKMARKDLLLAALLVLFLLSVLPLFSEPFYHQRRVNFWEWARRELIEEVEGEKSL